MEIAVTLCFLLLLAVVVTGGIVHMVERGQWQYDSNEEYTQKRKCQFCGRKCPFCGHDM